MHSLFLESQNVLQLKWGRMWKSTLVEKVAFSHCHFSAGWLEDVTETGWLLPKSTWLFLPGTQLDHSSQRPLQSAGAGTGLNFGAGTQVLGCGTSKPTGPYKNLSLGTLIKMSKKHLFWVKPQTFWSCCCFSSWSSLIQGTECPRLEGKTNGRFLWTTVIF